MKVKRRICVVTATRAEYGLLSDLMRQIKIADTLELQILVTGMHLSSEFGSTYQEIERDGFVINKKVDMLLSSDSKVGVTKSVGLGVVGFADALSELIPDLVVVLGDRFETLAIVIASTIANIPVAHLHGGELTEGAFDESFRHSITKMSHLHFVATEEYRCRVIQLGEQPERVYNFGALGADRIKSLKLLSKQALEESIDFKFGEKNLLVTFHPITLDSSMTENHIANLLAALDLLEETKIIFMQANVDTCGRIINTEIQKYVESHQKNTIFLATLGQLKYFSAMQYVDGVIGNSSSGLLEAPSFKLGTVNIGDRQKGRIKADSVIDCDTTIEGILEAINHLYSKSFVSKCQSVVNPYGEGGALSKILKTLKEVDLTNVLKKEFYDLR